MNRLRSSTAALLLSGSTLFAVVACGGASEVSVDAKKLYVAYGCITCHRLGGEGGPLGPPLRNLAKHWTPDTLRAYLLDPAATIAKDPRLQAQGVQYRQPMPALKLDPERTGILIDYLMTL